MSLVCFGMMDVWNNFVKEDRDLDQDNMVDLVMMLTLLPMKHETFNF